MATVKVFSLLIKTLSKPIASKIKSRAQDHPQFRKICVGLAQSLHRYETRLSSGIFAKVQPTVRPLSDTKAIQNGANFLSETFLFTVALGLIVGENLRGRIQTAHRRDRVNDRLDELEQSVTSLASAQDGLRDQLQKLMLSTSSHQDLLPLLNSPQSGNVGLEPLLVGNLPSSSHVRSSTLTLEDDELVKRAEVALGWRSP